MIHKELDCPVYNESVIFYTDCTPRQMKAHLKKEYGIVDTEMRSGGGDIGFLHNGEDHFIVWCKNASDLPTLVHELYHLCVKIFEYKGIPLTSENDEAMAYYLSYWLGKILPLIKE